MQAVTDKHLSGKRFWPELQKQIVAAGINPAEYNRALGRQLSSKKSQLYNIPMLSELPAVFNLLQTSPAAIFDAIGRHDYLLPETEDTLILFNQLEPAVCKFLTDTAQITIGNWLYACVPNNPAARVLLFLDHRFFPTGPSDFRVYKLRLKYRRIRKLQVPEAEMSEWIIGNSRRLPFSSTNIDIEQILDLANHLQVSFRWLYNYNPSASFYGYRPDAETLYDLWTLSTPEIKQMLIDAAKAKIKEVTY